MDKARKMLGFPFPVEYEHDFKEQYVRRMYKPALMVIAAILLFILFLICSCVFWPDSLGPPQYIPTLLAIYAIFFVCTAVVLCVSILLRRQVMLRPNLYFLLCNAYAVVILAWSSVLASFAGFSDIIFTALIYVSICVALVTLLKPWHALLMFSGNCLFFYLLEMYVWPAPQPVVRQIASAVLVAVLSIIISAAFYRFRTRTYYDHSIILRQVEEINTINARLQALIHLDQLTGLYNRRYFEEVLPGVLQDLQQAGRPVCGMMLDVNHFKAYNDRYGHPAGDLCLRRLGQLFGEACQLEPAHFVRYGGEEFFLLAVGRPEEAKQEAEAIRAAVEADFIEHLSHPAGRVTVSIGLVTGPADGTTLAELTGAADEALYRAKEAGRNQVVFMALE